MPQDTPQLRLRFSLVFVVILMLSVGMSVQSALAQVIWDDGYVPEPPPSGDGISWNDPYNWNTDFVPNGSDDVGLTTELVRVLDGFVAFAGSLATGETDLAIDGALTVFGTFENDSTVTIVSGLGAPNLNGASLTIGAGSTLEGAGEVLLRQTAAPGIGAARLTSIPGGLTTHGPEHTIRGEGVLAVDMINEGTIIAEDLDGVGGSLLQFDREVRNNNIVKTTASAAITAHVNITQGPNGRFIADGNTVSINRSQVTGGTLETTNGGLFRSSGNALGLNGVLLLGQLNMHTGIGAGVANIYAGGLVNDGSILLNETNAGDTFLVFQETATLDGTGEVIMNRPEFGAQLETSEQAIGTIGAGQTIRGVGRIEGNFVNNGLIIAEPRNGTTLQFVGGATTNNNIIRADAGSLLRLRDLTITQHAGNGQIIANDGDVRFENSRIVGGRLEATGAGSFSLQGGAHFTNVTNNADVTAPGGVHRITLDGTSFVNNGTVTTGNNVIVASNLALAGTGEIVLPTAVSSRLVVNAGQTATQEPGHTIRGAGQINGPGLFVNNGEIHGASDTALTEINGELRGTGLLKDVRIDGTHAPGNGVGSVPIEGNYRINNFGGTLAIEIGGTTAGSEYDQVVSTDPASVVTIGNSATTLAVSLVDLGNGYVPAVGDRFTILSSLNNIVGDFSTKNLTSFGLGRNITWGPIDRSDPTKYVLQIAAVSDFFFDADFDEDGDVDGDDLTRWQAGYGSTNPTHMNGNADGDIDVDGHDFLTWQRQFGSGVANVGAVAVPEPAAAVLLALLLVLPATRSKLHRR